jgi:phage-related protein
MDIGRIRRAVVADLVRLAFLAAHSRRARAAENLFLRKQLALFQERKVKPRSANDPTRWVMATLSRMFPWRGALVNVQADTLIGWHRKGFRLLWRWKSKPPGRPCLPKNLRQLIRQMAVENVTWGQERIASELQLKLGIRVSPRTVEKYLNVGGPVRTPDPKQRWLTFVRNHANVIIACDFFTVPNTDCRVYEFATRTLTNSYREYTQSCIMEHVRGAPKPVEWVGDSLKRVRAFVKPVRQQMGYELELVRHDMEPSDWKPISTVGPGVNEIRVHVEGEHRLFYIAKLRHAIYVLHVFQKKTQKTTKADIELARARFQEALRMEALKK